MMAVWMGYALLIATALGLAALAAERGLRLYRKPARVLWLGATAASVTLPALYYFFPASRALRTEPLRPALEVAIERTALALGPLAGDAGSASLVERINGPLAVIWALASAATLVYCFGSYFRLRRQRRRWSRRTMDGVDVLVSRDMGPGVVGFFRASIVVPAWALELDDGYRRMILEHEREHLRAGDHRLLLAGLISLILMPWNVALWWQVRRMRLAVELDCDERVMRGGADAGTYGELLIEVGQRASGLGLLPAALSEPRSNLEERVRNLIRAIPRRRIERAIVAAAVAGLLLAFACSAPSPDTESIVPQPGTGKLTGVVRHALTGDSLSNAQVYLEGTGRGALTATNGRYFLVNVEPGEYVLVAEREGYERARVTGVHVRAGETQQVDVTLVPDRQVDVTLVPEGMQAEGPVFTPFTVRPELKNRDVVLAALERNYPESLKARGIEGTVDVWIYVDTNGRVTNARINGSSGIDELDQAALAAVREFEFTPARNGETAVPVWISVPIPFSAADHTQREMKGMLRMIATRQEEHYSEAGTYYASLETEALRELIPDGVEIVLFEVVDGGWAVVAQKDGLECAMYYGRIAAPRPYARAGRAVCK